MNNLDFLAIAIPVFVAISVWVYFKRASKTKSRRLNWKHRLMLFLGLLNEDDLWALYSHTWAQKNIEAWLKELPTDIYSRILKYKDTDVAFYPWDTIPEDGHEAILLAIHWEQTDEGVPFWGCVYYGHHDKAREVLAMYEKERATKKTRTAI